MSLLSSDIYKQAGLAGLLRAPLRCVGREAGGCDGARAPRGPARAARPAGGRLDWGSAPRAPRGGRRRP